MARQCWHGDLVKAWQDYGVFGCVEATFNEKHYLWLEHAREAEDFGYGKHERYEWKDGTAGVMYTLPGKDFDTTVSVWCDLIDDKAVIFWECTSMKCDYEVAEKWVKETFRPKCSTNATNFHHVLHDIDRLTSGAV